MKNLKSRSRCLFELLAYARGRSTCGALRSRSPRFLDERVSVMSQQGQLIRLRRTGRKGEPLWAYRYRVGGRGSKRVQRGGFASERDAAEALERELERLRRERRLARSLTLAELVEAYLAQHDVEPVTIEKLRWAARKGGRRLRRATSQRNPVGGDRRLADRALTRLPLRRDPGASPGARARWSGE
jgi:hypothetical protein